MNIGFYILDIHQNDEFQRNILDNINKLCANRPYDNIVLFNNNFNTVDIDQKYYILSINHAKYFKGLLFLFDTESALLTRTFPGPSKQILYMSKPEWFENCHLPFTMWYNLYMDNRFELLPASKDMEYFIDTCWKKPLKTIEHFNHEELNNVIQQL